MLAVANNGCDDIFIDVHGHFVCSVEAMLELVAKGVNHNGRYRKLLIEVPHSVSLQCSTALQV